MLVGKKRFAGLFAIQGCGGGEPPAVETTAAADETTASP